jgi:hypothetical protein
MPLWRRSGPSPSEQPSPCRDEAARFVEIMGELAPQLRLDYSPASLETLEEFIAARFDPPGSSYVGEALPIGVGCYVGEVVVRNLGGRWQPDGAPVVVDVGGRIKRTYPVQKAHKRFDNGPEDNLAWFYKVVAKYAGITSG